MATTYTLLGSIERETSKAIQFTISYINNVPTDDISQEWFPLSQVTRVVRAGDGTQEDEIVVSEWIMKTKELI